MKNKRVYSRVFLPGKVVLMDNEHLLISSRALDFSIDGICLTGLSQTLKQKDYQMKLITDNDDQGTCFGAKLIHQNDCRAGFHITTVDCVSLKRMYRIYYRYA